MALPASQQKQIIDWLNTSSQDETLQHLHSHFGLQSSRPALSRFYAWWHLRHPSEQTLSFAEEIRQQGWDRSSLDRDIDTLEHFAWALFALKALKDQDFATFHHLARLRCQQDQLSLAQQKIDLSQAKFDSDANASWIKLLAKLKRDHTPPPFADQFLAQIKDYFDRHPVRPPKPKPAPNASPALPQSPPAPQAPASPPIPPISTIST